MQYQEPRPATSAPTYSAEEVAKIAREAAEEGARLALSRVVQTATATPPPSAADPYVGTAEAGRRMGKSVKTIRDYLRFAPKGEHAFAWKYGRDWRIEFARFEKWVRDDGPRLAARAIGRTCGSSA